MARSAEDLSYLERYIITGLIVSTGYITRIRRIWDSSLLESPELRKVADWCIAYYDKYGTAPDDQIKALYMEQLKAKRISKSEARYIEQVLADLSDEYGRGEQFNEAYLYDKTVQYFKARKIQLHNEEVQALLELGKIEEAEKLQKSFSLGFLDERVGLDLGSDEALERIERAFSETTQRVIQYPGALGRMWNDHMVRGGFVAFLAPEKRGKSWLLLELGLRAIRQRFNVAYFESGDMTEAQVLRRIAIYIAKRSDRAQYCEAHYCPVGDCVLNQLDLCTRSDRNCDHGIFEIPLETFKVQKQEILTLETLIKEYEEHPEYQPCDSLSCTERIGSVWLRKIPARRPLSGREARELVRRFFERYKRRFKLVNFPAGTLTVSQMRNILNHWERVDRFVPDVIIVDYADLLSAEDVGIREFRHKQNHIWQSLRGLAQEKHALVLTATQADADSYEQYRLTASNFSEDKRKLAHVTAMYGLNQDPWGREKRLGILRVNEIVVREGEFSPENEVAILQDLRRGRPFVDSYAVPLKEIQRPVYNIGRRVDEFDIDPEG